MVLTFTCKEFCKTTYLCGDLLQFTVQKFKKKL